MAKEEAISMVGEVIENLGPGGYKIRVHDLGMDVTAQMSGKMKKLHKIAVLPGDMVDVELSPYDPTKWRITYRHNKGKLSPWQTAALAATPPTAPTASTPTV